MPQLMRPDTRQHLTACAEPSDESASSRKQVCVDSVVHQGASLRSQQTGDTERRERGRKRLHSREASTHERTAGERVNGRLKDEFGGRHVRVRGASKVMCHCMFGVLALTADQLVRLVT